MPNNRRDFLKKAALAGAGMAVYRRSAKDVHGLLPRVPPASASS